MFENVKTKIEELENWKPTETEAEYLRKIDEEIREVWEAVESAREAAEKSKPRGFFTGSSKDKDYEEAREAYRQAVAKAEARTAELNQKRRRFPDCYRDAEEAVARAKSECDAVVTEMETARRSPVKGYDDVREKERTLFNLQSKKEEAEITYADAVRTLNNMRRPAEVSCDELRSELLSEIKQDVLKKLDDITRTCNRGLSMTDRINDIAYIDAVRATGRRPQTLPIVPSIFTVLNDVEELRKRITNM